MNAKGINFPKSLVEAVRVFADLDYATMFFAAIRWPDGVRCPHCGSARADYLPHRRLWQCREGHSRNQFSVKIGTIFEECRLTIDKCLIAVWLEVNAKNSISSCEIARSLKVTQKTGWFLLHRIRHALHVGSFETKLQGIIEADETYIGGRARNMHKDRKARTIKGGAGSGGKTAVMGLLQRHSEKGKSTVRAEIVDNVRFKSLYAVIHPNVEEGSHLMTDALMSYRKHYEYVHSFIDHTEKYVDGIVHTNGMENFWSLLKRCIKGTHVSVEPYHLAAYVDSEAFRFNNRTLQDSGRFVLALRGAPGKRLTYKALTGALEVAPGSDKDAASGSLPN